MHIIGGKFRKRTLVTPKGQEIRPTSNLLREALFNICQGYIEGSKFLDLFAGTGAIGFEALSRGACHVTFVDKHREALHCIRENIEKLEVRENCSVIYGDVFATIEKFLKEGRRFDIIYADPPYNTFRNVNDVSSPYSHEIIQRLDKEDLLKSGGTLFIEDALRVIEYTEPLISLKLVSSRSFGRSGLREYEKQ